MFETPDYTKKDNSSIFANKLERFYDLDHLNLDTDKKVNSVEELKTSINKKHIGDYVVSDDFVLSDLESGKVAFAYKEGDDRVLIEKENPQNIEPTRRFMEIEIFLKDKNFRHDNVISPIEIIITEDKIIRFYEAGDMNLEEYLKKHNKLPIKTSISLIVRACDGVNALHNVGVSNVDLAPLNIIISNKDLKITDFDAASIDIGNGDFLANNFVKNRFTSAPELFKPNSNFDKTVDIYSAAAILYRLVSGDWPYNIEKYSKDNFLSFEGKQIIYEYLHRSGKIEFSDGIPIELQKIIKKGMNSNPQERYQTMEEFILELINFLETEK
jgi:serine/threonine protein kinase